VSAQPARSALLVTHYFQGHGGGVEIVAGELARRLAENGASIEWFASATDAPPSYPGVVCRPQPALNVFERRLGVPFPLWSPAAFVRLARAVQRASVVHIHDSVYLANFIAAMLALVMRKRLVVTQHVGFVPYRSAVLRFALATANQVAVRAVLRRADTTIFVSPVVRKYFEHLAGPSDRYVDVANGVDGELFDLSGLEHRAAKRQNLGLTDDQPMMLFVGRFVEKKGLDAVREIARRRPAWQWYLAGDGPINPAQWGLANVHVIGRVPQCELAEIYAAADLLVLPSFGEGFPLVVQEALSAGLPVAVHTETRDAGALSPNVCVAEDVHGADAVDRWLHAMQRFVDVTPAEQAFRRSECRAFASQRWSWEATCQRYEQLLFAHA
jgi:glycosyltransferase involved in cell wall biosynthesis